MTTVAIVGGGIAGLSVGHAIYQRDPHISVVVFERHTRPGGNIRTEVVDGYVCEWGPDGFLDNAPDTLALAAQVGLSGRLRPSSDAARRRFIFRNGRLHEVPTSPLAFLRTPLLSARAKLRIAGEPFAASRQDEDETIFDFAARRIGTEPASALIDSMVSGIFAGDARSLSLRACFPKMWQLETEHGGLFRALLATRRQRKKGDAVGAPAGRLTSFEEGMEELVRGVAASLGTSLRTSAPVVELRRGRGTLRFGTSPIGDGYSLVTPTGAVDADAVVLAGPSVETAGLIRGFEPTAATLLAGIATAPLAVVCLGYDEPAVEHDRGPLDGFGFLVPRSEGVRILGALWETSIYPHRAPAGCALIRVMIGGALDPAAVALSDDDLLQIVRGDLRRTMGLAAAPGFVRIIRHARGIPQYTVGHLARLQRIETLLRSHPGLFLAGNSYRGVSINSCIAESGPLAERVLGYLRRADERHVRSTA